MYFTYLFDLFALYDVRSDVIFVIKSKSLNFIFLLFFFLYFFWMGNIERRFDQEQTFCH